MRFTVVHVPQVDDNQDGTYTISFSVGPAGDVKVAVRIGGTDLPPYLLTVNPSTSPAGSRAAPAALGGGRGRKSSISALPGLTAMASKWKQAASLARTAETTEDDQEGGTKEAVGGAAEDDPSAEGGQPAIKLKAVPWKWQSAAKLQAQADELLKQACRR